MKNIPVWPEWEIEKPIGEGSFGKVYKVRRERGGRVEYAALKVIEIPKDASEVRAMIASGMDYASVESFYESAANDLFNEIKIMESLRSAPNIVTLQDSLLEKKDDSIGWTLYIRMELLQSMEDYLYGRRPTKEEVMKLGTDICSAIMSCEKAHIIHRDIKPQNIFVNEFGDFKLGDFGIAKQLEKTGSVHSMKGSSMYMAPEIVKGKGYDHTVDIYSLGIMLYRYLNHGRAPFYPPYPQPITPIDIDNATQKKIGGEKMPAPDEADTEQASIILKACSYNPKQRYQSAEKMKDDLLRWQLKISMERTAQEDNVEKTMVLVSNTAVAGKKDAEDNKNLYKTEKQPHIQNSKNTDGTENKHSDRTSSTDQTTASNNLKSSKTKTADSSSLSSANEDNNTFGQGGQKPFENSKLIDQIKGKSKYLIIAASAVLLIGVMGRSIFGNRNNESDDELIVTADHTENQSSTPTPQSPAAAPVSTPETLRYSSAIWTLEPSLSAERAVELYTIYDSPYGIYQEHTGYPLQWNSKYTADGIALYNDGKYAIYDYSGNCLLPLSLDTLGYDAKKLVFYGSYNGSDVRLSYDFTSLTEKKSPVSKTEHTSEYVIYKNQFGSVPANGNKEFVPQSAKELSLQKRNLVAERDSSNHFMGWHLMDETGKIDNTLFEYVLHVGSNTAGFVTPFANDVFFVEDDSNKIAAIDADTGFFLTNFDYDDVKVFEDGYAPVMKNGKWGFIDSSGREVTDFIFDDASVLYRGNAYVKYNGLFGILNLSYAVENYGYLEEEGIVNSDFSMSSVTLNMSNPSVVSNPDSAQFPEDFTIYSGSDINIGNTPVQFRVQVITDKLNIRKEPSTAAEIVGQCKQADVYNVINSYMDDTYIWCQIGEGMWVADLNNQYLKLVE